QIMGIYTMLRLRFLPAVSVVWTILLVDAVDDARLGRVPASWIWDGYVYLLFANAVGMVAAFFMEHSARRDFLLSGLLAAEKEKAEQLLLNVLPESIAARLRKGQETIADEHADVTILFADIVGFTALSARMPPDALVRLLNEVFSEFDQHTARCGLEKIKTIGDAYMVAAGIPAPRPDHAESSAELALEMRDAVARLGERKGLPLRMRFGMHTGRVVAGVIGTRK